MYRRRLPHWRLPGSVYFVTWRLHTGQGDLTPAERTMVVGAQRHFEGRRYDLHAFVVMNDHAHALVRPYRGEVLSKLLHSWKSFTARRMQRESGRSGRVWQDESYDRIIRDEAEHLEKVNYILTNPRRRWPGMVEYRWQGVGKMAGTEPRGEAGTREGRGAGVEENRQAGTEARPTGDDGGAGVPAC